MRELLFVRVQNAYQTKHMPKNRFAVQRKMAAIVSHVCTCAENAVKSLTFKTRNWQLNLKILCKMWKCTQKLFIKCSNPFFR